MGGIKIIPYNPSQQAHFEQLNRVWIERFFEMEELDRYVLTQPQAAIIDPGGAILMATFNDEIAGTVALRKLDATTFEFTKMAVDERFRRKGIAEALSYASFLKANELGALTVLLYSNSVLEGAVQLYEKLGFHHLPADNKEYKRSDVKMSIDIKAALRSASIYYSKLLK
ncbi:MAG TPA: GNAT family N-acetyltransferase, partial [Ferruginibacter sp.]|nr:GNAT family N-acetyltransferase [Ferruginibacter sp.]